jgi:large subunit ribosomal protein L28
MAMKCSNCGKGVMYGHNVSHSKRRTRKIFKPNLHPTRVIVNNTSMKLKLCTKCLRMFKGKTTMDKKIAEVVASEATQTPEVAAA